MATFVVTYRYVPEPERLNDLRPSRYIYFQNLDREGVLCASGQLDGELGEGMLVLDAADRAAAESLLDDDPFVRAGVVTERQIARWNPTVGTWVG